VLLGSRLPVVALLFNERRLRAWGQMSLGGRRRAPDKDVPPVGFQRRILELHVSQPPSILSRDGEGSVVPIKISGTRSKPSFGIDLAKIVRREK